MPPTLGFMDTQQPPYLSECICVWAPYARDLRLVTREGAGDTSGEKLHRMRRGAGDWWCSEVPARPGLRYGFQILGADGQWSKTVPDPRSLAQPDGPHGLSEIPAGQHVWGDAQWTGRGMAGQVIYELHVGTFSAAGTFDGVAEKLGYLRDMGVTSIELMPINPFGGARNWGYDGVGWHAVHEAYGGPAGLKRLVDAAHAQGIGVILDVVYNHFGPDGNYVGMFGPYTAGGSTGWGEVVNMCGYQSDEVRAYILDAVRLWFEEYHIDGLRLDAVHAFVDTGAYSIMEDIQLIAEEVSARTGVQRIVIAESDLNDPRLISAREAGGYGLAGQWVDDIHHAIHTLVSGEHHAYYADFGSLGVLAKTLREGFLFSGDYSTYRGRRHGRRINRELTPAYRLVTYTTTHDQTGNRAKGDRPSQNLSAEQQVLKAALVLCSPYTPMLFMGEEFGAKTPFPFFCSHGDEGLNEATRQGRFREFRHSGWAQEEVPDPACAQTFESAKLVWDFDSEQMRILAAYRKLIGLRKTWNLTRPQMSDFQVDIGRQDPGAQQGWVAYGFEDISLVANLSDTACEVPYGGQLVYSFSPEKVQVGAKATALGPWAFALVKR